MAPDNEGSNPSGHTNSVRLAYGTDQPQTVNYLSPAQRAAMEKSLAAYMVLECGHSVTREEALLFSVFAPSIKDIFCERCDEFKKLRKPRGRTEYPTNPLF